MIIVIIRGGPTLSGTPASRRLREATTWAMSSQGRLSSITCKARQAMGTIQAERGPQNGLKG